MSFLMQLQDVEAAGRLAPFSAAFRAGEIVHLVGPNGAGKSTLLTRMAGLSDGPGTVHFNGRLLDEWPARELARRRGYLSQHQTRRSPCRYGTTWRCICSSRVIAPV
ncbi:Vitamin B12 ABC transporter, ATPase component BtuD [Klebsiella pneumoniae subsp. ozaenae]|uniref:Vitamin B12 ABC transporter, ATPase component BtuD n=1 Tax=Klebsiella pneumoniae subsp. ozaenae TaxID=574 RepID=A0A377ZJ97_KLEPO|nr:Vitamin B12 ABC transporter, ATPase component BtuD [Klebsiella pneumoniae subsp. ozaenae]